MKAPRLSEIHCLLSISWILGWVQPNTDSLELIINHWLVHSFLYIIYELAKTLPPVLLTRIPSPKITLIVLIQNNFRMWVSTATFTQVKGEN